LNEGLRKKKKFGNVSNFFHHPNPRRERKFHEREDEEAENSQ
jgi:hypothetical protein